MTKSFGAIRFPRLCGAFAGAKLLRPTVLRSLGKSHAPAGISQRHVARLILQSKHAMRGAQLKISKRIVGLLGLQETH
jgi:hypothetical protein